MKKVKFIIEESISKEFEIEVEDDLNIDSEEGWENLEQKIKEGYAFEKFVVDKENVNYKCFQVLDDSGEGLTEWIDF